MHDDILQALQTSRAWINYAPARPFDFVIGQHPVTEHQLQAHVGSGALYPREAVPDRAMRHRVT
jgi:hypothetical protein